MPVMESVTLENFRCFREKQTVGLAPLTLLVGENSTGKTSFLALIQALVGYAYDRKEPTFKEPPFDLGTFDEIVHSQSNGAGSEECFTAGMTANITSHPRGPEDGSSITAPTSLDLTFANPSRGTVPALVRQRVASGGAWVDESVNSDGVPYKAILHTERGEWEFSGSTASFGMSLLILRAYEFLKHFDANLGLPVSPVEPLAELPEFPVKPLGASPQLTIQDIRQFRQFGFVGEAEFAYQGAYSGSEAIAPVRTHPLRSYNPSSITKDSDGDYVASYLADLVYREDLAWPHLKAQLEAFGERAGLFEEIEVHVSEHAISRPFEVRMRIIGQGQRTVARNLVDVGYGVSQALPIIVALLRPDGAAQFLLQQPEVHLHPSAQAELGSLFCEVAAQGRQLIVETHSDHLMDRIRMDIRDGRTALRPEDVRILYFEREGLDVKIHEITYDKMGNLQNTPPGYRSFFMKEIERSLWPPD